MQRSIKLIAFTQPVEAPTQTELLTDIMGTCRGKECNDKALFSAIYSGHVSLLEHVSYTWRCEGWSRNMLLELERHRIGVSLTVESTRAVNMSERLYNYAKTNPEAATAILYCRFAYTEMLGKGKPLDEAREILPGGLPTKFVVTMNLNALQHFVALRLCRRAHPEIRDFAARILFSAENLVPSIRKFTGPPCQFDECREVEKCGSATSSTLAGQQ